MLDQRLVTDNPEQVRERLSIRGEVSGLDRLVELGQRRRTLIREVEDLRHEQKTAGARMKDLMKSDPDAAAELRAKLKTCSARQKDLDADLKTVEDELKGLLLEIPNLPHESVVPGEGEEDNPLIRSAGEPIFRRPFKTLPV